MLILENISFQTAKKTFNNSSKKKIKFSIGIHHLTQTINSSIAKPPPGLEVKHSPSGLKPSLFLSSTTKNTASRSSKNINLDITLKTWQ